MTGIRIGCGSSCEACRIEEAERLINSGRLNYMSFDRLSERTTAEMLYSLAEGSRGYCRELVLYTNRLVPNAARRGMKLITNAGGEDPSGALKKALDVLYGAGGIRVAALVPRTDVLSVVERVNPTIVETGRPYRELPGTRIGATAYYSSQGVTAALRAGADYVICGRVGDSALYLAPLAYEFGWDWTDWDRLARGMAVGHLLECGPQLTGGYYAAPPLKFVPDLATVGLPYAEVDEDGNAAVTKLESTGGKVTTPIVHEQMLYEVGDPANYIHTDVVVDFTTARVEQVGPNRVRVENVTGHPKPDTLKVLVAVHEGFLGECFSTFGGSDAYERAQLAAETMRARVDVMALDLVAFNASYLGVSSLFEPWGSDLRIPREVTVHIAARFRSREDAVRFVADCQIGAGNCWGPAGGATGRTPMAIEDMPAIYTTYLDRALVEEPELLLEDV